MKTLEIPTKLFGKIRRPASWLIFLVGFGGMLITLVRFITSKDFDWAAMGVFFMLTADGYGMVDEVES